jgi:general secretion pathway protein D
MSMINQMVKYFFYVAGVNLYGTNTAGGGGIGGLGGLGMMGGMGMMGGVGGGGTGKAVFYNDRTGLLMVRATLQDLDIVEVALQVLNIEPDQLTIEVKFVDISQEDSKALGFDWFLGQTMIRGGAIGASGGTYPSVSGAASQANPYGVFPGVFGQPSVLPNAATDQWLSSGLRNTSASGNPLPAVGTITGILTDPQFRVVIRALEQRKGVDILASPRVTTVNGRQAQIQAVDIEQIVIGLNVGGIGGGATTTGLGGVGGVGAVGAAGGGGTVTTGGAVQ